MSSACNTRSFTMTVSDVVVAASTRGVAASSSTPPQTPSAHLCSAARPVAPACSGSSRAVLVVRKSKTAKVCRVFVGVSATKATLRLKFEQAFAQARRQAIRSKRTTARTACRPRPKRKQRRQPVKPAPVQFVAPKPARVAAVAVRRRGFAVLLPACPPSCTYVRRARCTPVHACVSASHGLFCLFLHSSSLSFSVSVAALCQLTLSLPVLLARLVF